MPGFDGNGRGRGIPLQATQRRARNLCTALIACGTLLGCSDPVSKPVDLFHDLEGGEIAAERPPPPGAGQPYPHVGTVPDKPVMPDKSFRTTLQQELATERDQKELLAADLPAEKVPPPPGPSAAPAPQPAAATPPAPTTSASVTGAVPQPSLAPPESPTGDAPANATLSAADAPPPPPHEEAKPAAPPPPPSDATLQIVGDPVEAKNLPLVPDAPPPPATFEGMPAQPAPTPRLLPPHLPTPRGTQIFFDQGSDKLTQSQRDSINDVASHRKAQTILVTGLGEADSDTPFGQETALDLAVRRARAVAQALSAVHVPQSAMRIAAQPFGRGAVVTLIQ